MTPTYTPSTRDKNKFLQTGTNTSVLMINIILAVIYFAAILFAFPKGNTILFWLLISGEVFHLWQLLTYIFTVWNTEYQPRFDPRHVEPVDVYITVAGEPIDVVEETVSAAKRMNYPDFEVHILNDGYVAKKDNWQDIEHLAYRLGVNCITRMIPGGAKAGNINNALRNTRNPLVVVFDADHIPHEDFLEKTVGYFADPKMGYVQSPQYYRNHNENEVTQGAWEQQALFFGAISKGKNRLNSVTMCGTNMVIRRDALEQVGGIYEGSIAEDFVTGMFIHRKGWKSCYVPEVLAEGLAPEDFQSYYNQQFRWARGSLDVLFHHNILFSRGLTLSQRIQYLSSVSYFVSGLIVLMNAIIPLMFFYFGIIPLKISTMSLAAIFLPYIFVTIYALQSSSNFSYSFKSLAFSMAGFNVHIKAVIVSILGKKSIFAVTSKKKLSGNFLRFVIPHMLYVVAAAVGIIYAFEQTGLTASFLSNSAWALLNVAIFGQFISAAMPSRVSESSRRAEAVKQNVINGVIANRHANTNR
jgi:cellulose synthase (UDP-forming)